MIIYRCRVQFSTFFFTSFFFWWQCRRTKYLNRVIDKIVYFIRWPSCFARRSFHLGYNSLYSPPIYLLSHLRSIIPLFRRLGSDSRMAPLLFFLRAWHINPIVKSYNIGRRCIKCGYLRLYLAFNRLFFYSIRKN